MADLYLDQVLRAAEGDGNPQTTIRRLNELVALLWNFAAEGARTDAGKLTAQWVEWEKAASK